MTPTLFILDTDRLKASLRLSGSDGRDSEQMLDDAVMKARMTFYRRLTPEVIAAIVATTSVDSPSTPDQLKRSTAEMLEILLVRRDLLTTMPVFTMDPNTQQEVWNEDALVRKMSRKERDDTVARMDAEIETMFGFLTDADLSANGLRIGVSEDVNPRPGRYVFDSCVEGEEFFLP